MKYWRGRRFSEWSMQHEMQHALKKVLYYRTFFNGDSGIRTHDLLNAIQTLSQLSYAPMTVILLYRLPCLLSTKTFIFHFEKSASARVRSDCIL